MQYLGSWYYNFKYKQAHWRVLDTAKLPRNENGQAFQTVYELRRMYPIDFSWSENISDTTIVSDERTILRGLAQQERWVRIPKQYHCLVSELVQGMVWFADGSRGEATFKFVTDTRDLHDGSKNLKITGLKVDAVGLRKISKADVVSFNVPCMFKLSDNGDFDDDEETVEEKKEAPILEDELLYSAIKELRE